MCSDDGVWAEGSIAQLVHPNEWTKTVVTYLDQKEGARTPSKNDMHSYVCFIRNCYYLIDRKIRWLVFKISETEKTVYDSSSV